MSSKRTPLLWIEDMHEAASEVMSFTEGLTFEGFISCMKTLKAVLFNVQILGEAANKLPDDIKAMAPEVPWDQIRGLRNRVAHEYFDMNLEMIWTVTQQHIPPLVTSLEKLKDQIEQ